jgi:hypothetical protein
MRSKLIVPCAVAAFTGTLFLAGSPAFAQNGAMQTAPMQSAQPAPDPMAAPQQSTATPQSTTATAPGSTATQPATEVSSPKTALASATVQDSSGQPVGQVQSVKTTSGGKASTVAVSVTPTTGGAAKIVSIKASRLRYDPSGNILKASLSSSEINALPATQNQ